MKRLTKHLGGPRLWVKREDLLGIGCGGNKVRKLDYVLREAVDIARPTNVATAVCRHATVRLWS